ncbi:hypothetical protein ACTWP5_05270 [Streptomyces sp. 4N509B]|uniref:hypothetical protein n=1 Tax=Streptomyces sp. 4N509B TaxID=3457413 RepID=UPI003FCFBD3B
MAHPWVGRRVVHPASGRTGRLGLVMQHLHYDVLGREKLLWTEAHVRRLDGSGWEWRFNLDDLTPADEHQQQRSNPAGEEEAGRRPPS